MHKEVSGLVFAGPSLTHQTKQLIDQTPQLMLCPPIQRGDLPRWLKQRFRGDIVIVDGLFGQSLAVGHAEIRHAIEQGCKVYGLSSMGAIRAYEMRHLGMIGYGKVYERFAENDLEDFQDDEVALLHTSDSRPLSEPLIHMRVCIDDLVNRKVIVEEQGKRVIAQLKGLYFGDRTMHLFQKIFEKETSLSFKEVVVDFDQYRIKASDLSSFLIRLLAKTN